MRGLIDKPTPSYIVGCEARGFIFGSYLKSKRMGTGFVPVRKKGKLPPPVISRDYELEYGTDTLEIKLMVRVELLLWMMYMLWNHLVRPQENYVKKLGMK